MKKLTYIPLFLLAICCYSQDWKSNYQEALAISKNENKPLLLLFSGSDWCTPCIKLEAEIFKTEEFISYATKNYVLYKADFPRKKVNQLSDDVKHQNNTLADKYNPKGHFPLIVVLNKEQNILGKTGYKKATPAEYIAHINTYVN